MQFMKAAKTLASLHICTGSLEPSYLDNVITLPKSGASNSRAIYVSMFGRLQQLVENLSKFGRKTDLYRKNKNCLHLRFSQL